ncbi:hypothetical protein LSPH24S_05716 [Lysinibacillus sphaericus]
MKRILDFEDTFDVIAEGDDGTDVVNLYAENQPVIVVLMDINMRSVKMVVERLHTADF